MKNLPNDFASRLRVEGLCWIWTGSVDSRGYGNAKYNGRPARTHRMAYEYANGPIPKGEGHHGVCVLHTCDTRLCCNPAHLRLGTHADNMRDMAEKGRRKGINTCARNGRAKLTEVQVAAIRTDPRGKRVIAQEYGISPAQVQRVRSGLQWRVTSEPTHHPHDHRRRGTL